MDVSVIIVNYNTMLMTSECIDSIIEKTKGIRYEIILVDNASTDGSKEFFEQDKRIKYQYNDINLGFGAGNNIGAKYARGKYLFFLNSDTLLQNNAIKIFFNFAEKYIGSCVCGGWLTNKDNVPNCSYVQFPRMSYVQFLRSLWQKKVEYPVDTLQKVDVVCGADMFLPRKIFIEENGFDENIFLNGEEVELQYRFKQLGYNRILIPGPKITHFEGLSPKVQINNSVIKNHYYFLKKHMPKHMYYAARFYYSLNYLLKWILNPKQNNYLSNAFIRVK